jgi:hypothetical protein
MVGGMAHDIVEGGKVPRIGELVDREHFVAPADQEPH